MAVQKCSPLSKGVNSTFWVLIGLRLKGDSGAFCWQGPGQVANERLQAEVRMAMVGNRAGNAMRMCMERGF